MQVVGGAKMNDTNLPTVEQLLESADRKVKELSRAIHCLPKPPEKMGDGPDERVANVIFLLQKAREERAEVLAACINALCCHCSAGHKPDKNGFHFLSRTGYLNERVRCPAFTLHSFQPAASDLEELLREAELEMLERIRTDEGGVYVYCPGREVTNGPTIIRLDVFIRAKKRQISELEKARAILEKP